MPGPGSEWPDGRLNELALRVERAATKEEMASLRVELRERAEGVKRDVKLVSKKLDGVVGDPVVEKRQKRAAIIVAVMGAFAGVTGTALLYIVTAAH